MNSLPVPQNIQVIGNELAIVWQDGTESYFSLEFLRRRCPCASCSGEADLLNAYKPNVSYSPKSFTIESIQIVGGYAWQPRWGDGHQTGLYSWQYLHQLQ